MAQLFTEEAIYKKTPQELTSLLYESLLDHLEESIELIHQKKFFEVNENLKTTNLILYRLGAGLNYEKGGIIADQLDALYNYMAEKVIEANLKKDIKIIEEVLQIASQLTEAWNQAIKNKKDVSQLVRHRSNAYEQNVMVDGRK